MSDDLVDHDLRKFVVELVRLRLLAVTLAWLLVANILVTGLNLAMAFLGR